MRNGAPVVEVRPLSVDTAISTRRGREGQEPLARLELWVIERFEGRVHVPRQAKDRDIDAKLFASQFTLFEEMLTALVRALSGAFYPAADDLDEILEDANS